MRSLSEACGLIEKEARPGEAIEVGLADAVGLVLAEPLTGDVDLPPFDRAAVDGYAVRAADAEVGTRLAGGRKARRRRRSASRTGDAEISLGPRRRRTSRPATRCPWRGCRPSHGR